MWPHFSLDAEIAAEVLSEVYMKNHKRGKADRGRKPTAETWISKADPALWVGFPWVILILCSLDSWLVKGALSHFKYTLKTICCSSISPCGRRRTVAQNQFTEYSSHSGKFALCLSLQTPPIEQSKEMSESHFLSLRRRPKLAETTETESLTLYMRESWL